jgi:hypothetical protein
MFEGYRAEEIAAEWRRSGDQFGDLIARLPPDFQAGSPAWSRRNSTMMSRVFPSLRRSTGLWPEKALFADRSHAGISGRLIDSVRIVHNSSRSRS